MDEHRDMLLQMKTKVDPNFDNLHMPIETEFWSSLYSSPNKFVVNRMLLSAVNIWAEAWEWEVSAFLCDDHERMIWEFA